MRKDWIETSDGKFAYDYKRAAIAADNVVFGFDGGELKVLLIERNDRIEVGKMALPGGFLRMEETIEECAARELQEETGIVNAYSENFGTFTALDRDPEQRVVSSACYALVPTCEVIGGSDARRAVWVPLKEVGDLAFDHNEILAKAVQRLREDIVFRPVGYELLPEKFTLPQLQRLYECILGLDKPMDRANFSKKILNSGILVETGETEQVSGHRGGNYYRFDKDAYDRFKQERSFKLEF